MSPIPIFTSQPYHVASQVAAPPEHILSARRSSSSIAHTNSQLIPRSTNPDTPNTGVVIAAVLSSILGTLVLLTILYKCCINNRSAAYIPPAYTSYSTSSLSSDDNGGVRRRGGGLHNHHHHGVSRPERVRVRAGSSRHGSRYRERHGRTTRVVRGNKDGMLGWFWMPRMRYGYDNRRYGWPRDYRYRDCVDD